MKTCTSENEYIKLIAPHVQRACKRYGYLPSVLIAQSCLENGYGIPSYWDNPEISKLMDGNNMVGIKAELLSSSWNDKTVWDGKVIRKTTPEEYSGKIEHIQDDFRAYNSIEESFVDYLLFMTYASNNGYGGTPKYGKAILSIKDPATLIREVSRRGYATGSTYSSNVMKIVNKHDLTVFDNLADVSPTTISFDKKSDKMIKKITGKALIDITDRNRNQVPRSRGNNPISYIVCHYLGVPNADNPDLYGGGYGGHYNVKRNGQVYKAADPHTAVVWHCGGGLQGSEGHTFYQKCTNYNSIGIECGVCYAGTEKEPSGDSGKWFFTEETQESLVWLVSKLMDEYGIPIEHVIRHFDVTGKICPNPYVKNNKFQTSWTWAEFKANLTQYRKDGTITIGNIEVPQLESLRIGDRGDEVSELQLMLNTCGYNCGNVDGIFGSKTYNAVRKFQKANNIGVTGVFDNDSKIILKSLYNGKKDAEQKVEGTVFNGTDYAPVYNYTYYKKKYADLRAAFGNTKQKYFEHFCQFGMKEGRQGSASFDVKKYKNRYADLQKAFGNNLPEYYKHYCVYGKKEGRKAT